MRTSLEGFGKLAVERDRLLFELEAYQKAELTRQNSESPKIERMSERPLEAQSPDHDSQALERTLDEKNQKILELEKSLEGYGRLAVERDRLLIELDSLMLALNSKEYARSGGIKREEEFRQLKKRNLDLTENMKRLQEIDERQSNKLWEKDKKITELEKSLDGFGKLAIERDVLKRELESTRLLLGDTEPRSKNGQDNGNLLKTIEAQKLEIEGKEQTLKQLNLQMAGYGELAVKKEILDRELESLRIIMKHNKEDEFQKLEMECQNLRVELESSKIESHERLLECERLGNQVEELKEKLRNFKTKDVESGK